MFVGPFSVARLYMDYLQLIYTEVSSIIIPIFQRRRQRLKEPSYLAKVTQSVKSVFLFHSVVSPREWHGAWHVEHITMVPLSFPLSHGRASMCESKVQAPSMACKNLSPLLASSLSVSS